MAINWSGDGAAASLAGIGAPPSQDWLSQLLATNSAEAPVDLGKVTGLKVML